MSGPFTGVREGESAPSSACFLLSSQDKAFALTYGLDTGERKGKKSSLEHLACLQIPHPLSIRATDCTALQGYEPQTWEVGRSASILSSLPLQNCFYSSYVGLPLGL